METATNLKPANFKKWAAQKKTEIERTGYQEETLRSRRILRNIRFLEGRHLGYISPKSGQWVDVEPLPNDPYHVNNQFKVYIRALLKEFVKSNARLKVEPRNDRMESQGAARLSASVIDLYRDRVFRASQKHFEAMQAFTGGSYMRYTYWDMSNDSFKETVPVTEPRQVKVGEDSLYCPTCGFSTVLPPQSSDPTTPVQAQPTASAQTPPQTNGSETSPAPQPMSGNAAQLSGTPTQPDTAGMEPQEEVDFCPQCGSIASVMRSPSVTIDEQVGEEEVVTGDLAVIQPDNFEVKVHPRARAGKIADTPWLLYRRRQYKSILKQTFPKAKLTATESGNVPLHYQKTLESSPGNYATGEVGGSTSGGELNDLMEEALIWLDPQEYFGEAFEEDFVRPTSETGETIPAGTPYSQVYPDGMFLRYAGSELLDERNESKNDYWTFGRYFLNPHTFWGSGVEDAVEQQRQLNEYESLILESVMHTAAPPAVYNPLKIQGSSMSGKPRERVPLKNATLADKPGDFIDYPQGRTLGGDVLMQPEQKKRDMQAIFGSFSVVAGMPDVNVTTATGMAILRDQALGFLAPPLELKGECEVDWAYQVLKLVKKNMTGKRYLNLGKFNSIEGQWFEAADIETDLVITVYPDSFFPRNSLERRNDLLEAGSAFGVPLGIWNPAVPSHVRRLAAERYDIPLDADTALAQERKQKIELEKMRVALQQLESQGIPTLDELGNPNPQAVVLVAQTAPADMLIDEHTDHINWIRSYLVTDEGMEDHPVLQEALKMHLQEHWQMQNQMQMIQSAMMAQNAAVQMAATTPQPTGGAEPQQSSPTAGRPGDNLPHSRTGSTDRPKPGAQA